MPKHSKVPTEWEKYERITDWIEVGCVFGAILALGFVCGSLFANGLFR